MLFTIQYSKYYLLFNNKYYSKRHFQYLRGFQTAILFNFAGAGPMART